MVSVRVHPPTKDKERSVLVARLDKPHRRANHRRQFAIVLVRRLLLHLKRIRQDRRQALRLGSLAHLPGTFLQIPQRPRWPDDTHGSLLVFGSKKSQASARNLGKRPIAVKPRLITCMAPMSVRADNRDW